MKIISWNLFHRRGAAAAHISALVEQERPDLVLMQEATHGIGTLPSLIGGEFHTEPWHDKAYSLAAWVPAGPLNRQKLELPVSNLPGVFPQRVAQVLTFEGLSVVNVHLSHGQLLNRKQLRTIADVVDGPLAIVGDFNTLGPVVLRGFTDAGPRRRTHMAQRLLPLRLDRCLLRGVRCLRAETLERGPSDHWPIMLEIEPH